MDKIKVIYKEPLSKPRCIVISNTPDSICKLLGGVDIRYCQFASNAVLLYHAMAVHSGDFFNFYGFSHIFYGPVILCGVGEDLSCKYLHETDLMDFPFDLQTLKVVLPFMFRDDGDSDSTHDEMIEAKRNETKA